MSAVAAFENLSSCIKALDLNPKSEESQMKRSHYKETLFPSEDGGKGFYLRIKYLSFAYEKEQGEVLNKINLSICLGKTTLFRGPSVAGKSTIVSLLLGLLKEY